MGWEGLRAVRAEKGRDGERLQLFCAVCLEKGKSQAESEIKPGEAFAYTELTERRGLHAHHAWNKPCSTALRESAIAPIEIYLFENEDDSETQTYNPGFLSRRWHNGQEFSLPDRPQV